MAGWDNTTATGQAQRPTATGQAQRPTTTFGPDYQQGTSVTSGATNSSTGSAQSGSESSNSTTTALDPSSMEVLQQFITQLMSGGTANQKGEMQKRDAMTQFVTNLMGLVSPEQANADAQGLMGLQLQKSLEQQMPALQKAVEGAGTSASSMQALLANKIAQDTALNAAALGGEQKKAYAQSRAQLAALLEAFTRPQNTVENTLVQALNALKGAITNTNSTRYSSQTGTQNTVGKTDSTTNTAQVAQRGAINPVTQEQSAAAPDNRFMVADNGSVIQYNPVNTAGIDNGISIQNTTNSNSSDTDTISSLLQQPAVDSGTNYSDYSSAEAVRQAANDNIDYRTIDPTDYLDP